MKNYAILILITLCLGLAGCNSQPINTAVMNNTSSMKSEMGTPDNFQCVVVRTQGGISDLSVGLLNAMAPSPLSRSLANLMAKGEDQPFALAVTGYSLDKTKNTILTAAKLNADKQLSKLKFMYVGYPEANDEIKHAIENLGSKYYFKSFIEEDN